MYGRVTRPLLDFSERGLGTRLRDSDARRSPRAQDPDLISQG